MRRITNNPIRRLLFDTGRVTTRLSLKRRHHLGSLLTCAVVLPLVVSAMVTLTSGPARAVTGYGPYSVVGTGSNGLNDRSAPSTSGGVLGNLKNGTAIYIACQVSGGAYATGGSPATDAIWDQLTSGGYVADYWVSTPSVGSFSPGIATCGANPPSSQTPPPAPGGSVNVGADEFVNQAHGQCLDAAAQTDASNGGKIQLWSCLNGTNQNWVRQGNELVNQAHGLCLDAAAQTDGNNGGAVQLWSCVNDANQQWIQYGTELVNQAHSLCLDAAAQTDGNNGGTVELWSCWGGANQNWVTPQHDEILNQAHGLCLDAAAQTDGNYGGIVQMWSCVNDSNQQWVLNNNELVNQAHGLCLDAAAQTDGNNGGTVELWPCWGGANQQWVRSGGELVNQAHGLCLDAAAQNDGNNGGTVQLWSCWGGTNQQWLGPNGTQYPFVQTEDLVCGHLFQILSPTMASDPSTQPNRIQVPRSYTFGYSGGHCVYKISDQAGIDVNTHELIQLTNYYDWGWHWDVLGAAGEGAAACEETTAGWPPEFEAARAAAVSWCGAVSSLAYVF